MKKIFILGMLLFLSPQLVEAQSQRNPCYYTTTGITSCQPVGTSVTGVANGPLPVGGVANAFAPTFVEGKVGGLSFDLGGNLRVVTSGGGTVSGNVSNASSGVATTSTNVPTVSYNYVWNGATWDQAGGLQTGSTGVPSTQVVTVQFPASNGQYPTASIPITGNSTGSTAAVVGTLAATASKTTYICGFDVSAIGGTAAVGPITIAGLVGSSMVYQLSSSAAGVTLSRSFNPCIPASTTNTAITITTTADGTATAVDVNSWGFQQ